MLNENYNQKYYSENKEKLNKKHKEYREANKEAFKKRHKENYEKNKEKRKEQARLYRLENKEKISISKKKAYNTEKGIKQNRIQGWKRIGIVCDYEEIYNIYINTHKCNYCNKDFKNDKNRNLDHNHDTGMIRGILCMSCNVKDVLKNL